MARQAVTASESHIASFNSLRNTDIWRYGTQIIFY